jgi:hypothetical protein
VASERGQLKVGGQAAGFRDESRAGGFFAFPRGAQQMDNDTDLVPMLVAAKALGMSDAALRRRVRRAAIPVFRDRIDLRLRLLRASDVERLRAPRWVTAADPGDATTMPEAV